MNISTIETFIYVYHLSGFHKAANALYLTQPTISSRIQSLEKDLNTILFHRNQQAITLTEAGKVFLPYAYRIYHSYKEAKIQMGQEIQELSIGSITSVSTSLLPKLIANMKEAHPAISLNIHTGPTRDMVKKVVEEECHFGITEAIQHPDLHTILFHKDKYSLVVPPKHRLLQLNRPATFQDIFLEPFITISKGAINSEDIEHIFAKHNLKPNIVFEVDNIETIKVMILKQMGISFLPQLCFENELLSGKLFTVPLSPALNIHRNIEIIYPKGSKPPFLNFFI